MNQPPMFHKVIIPRPWVSAANTNVAETFKRELARQDAQKWLQVNGYHKSLPAPVITGVRYDLTAEQKTERDEYIKEHFLPF